MDGIVNRDGGLELHMEIKLGLPFSSKMLNNLIIYQMVIVNDSWCTLPMGMGCLTLEAT